MAVGTLINTISRLLGLPTFPKKGVNKFQYLDTRFRSTVSVSGPLIAESVSAQLGESLMCGTKFLLPNPLTPTQAIPPQIIATPLSYLLNFGGAYTNVSSNMVGINNLTGLTNISGLVNLNGLVNINGRNLDVELALGKALPSSDERLKKNIHTITNPIEKVNALRGVPLNIKKVDKNK